MNNWFVDPSGETREICTMDCIIEDILGTALVKFIQLAPGLRMWICLPGAAADDSWNAPATSLVDALWRAAVYALPRIHGAVVVEIYSRAGLARFEHVCEFTNAA
jgi:hypothetical protein